MSATDPNHIERKRTNDWLRYILMALLVEKIIQHCFVTLAFYFDRV